MIASRVFIAALLANFATALPHRRADSAINEPAVSAPDGTPITEGTPAATAAAAAAAAADNGSSGGWDGSMSQDAPVVVSESSNTGAGWNSYQTPSSQPSNWTPPQVPTYGSGSSNWGSWSGGSNYNDCVSQCMAQYGNSPQPWTPPPTQTSPEVIGSGNGVTHTVIVAPSQGVLRYVPFAVNASVGDTVKFMWGANNHTVTKSSQLTPCNKTLDSAFASGIQIKDFTFEQVVNDTNPTYFFCAVPGHCQKGMFGMINPPSNFGAGTSVSLMMSQWTSSNPDLAAYSAITSNMTADNKLISRWGGNIDVANLPEWSHPLVAENVMYTRSFLASNPETMGQDGSIDLSGKSGAPLMIPQDISVALSNANLAAPSSPVPAPVATGAPAGSTDASTAPQNASPNSAATASPKFVIALVAAAASFLML